MDSLSRLIARAVASGFGRRIGVFLAVSLLALAAGKCHAYGTVNVGTAQTSGFCAPGANSSPCDPADQVIDPYSHFVATFPVASLCGDPYVCYVTLFSENSTTLVLTVAVQGHTEFGYQGAPKTYQKISIQVPACPPNSSGSLTCTCNSGYKPNTAATQCEPVNCKAIIDGLNQNPSNVLQTTVQNGNSFCYGGCQVSGSFWGTDANGTYVAGPFTSSGPCAGTTNDGGTPPFTPRPGECPGQVNGADVSVSCSGGQGTQGPAKSASGPAGSSNSNSGATCVGGVCTTTTTTTDGNGTGTETTTESQDSFCQKNPGLQICKDAKGTFGGTCSSSFSCEGDAVQCAIATEQHRRDCQLFEVATADSDTGTAARSAGSRASDHPWNSRTTVDMSGGFDQTDLIGSSCPADVPVPINSPGGGTVVWIRYSALCTPAEWLGRVLVGLTALACAGIVFKGA